MKRLLLAFVALVLLQGASLATPAVSSSTTRPDPLANPVLASLQKMGAKFFLLGTHSGMTGWFILKDGQVQIVYATPDNKSAVIGALFGENGDNITAQQIAGLVQSNKEVADLISSAQKEQTAISQVGSPPSQAASASSTGSIPSAPMSPGERLIHDLSGAAGVVVGNASSPEILMVMDPHCPYCQATWTAVRDVVMKGGVHLRLIPIATLDTDNERAAAVLLGASDPLSVWDKYVSGDKSQLAGTPPAAAFIAVRANHTLTDGWKIMDTPYIVYRAKDNKVKVVKGKPDDAAVVLRDLGL